MGDATVGDPAGTRATAADIAVDVRRISDRLRTLSQSRLAAVAPPFDSRAAAGRHAAQALADASQGVEEASARTEPTWRSLPELSDFAVGDMVAVTGHDLLAACAATDDQLAWTRQGQQPRRAVIDELAGLLAGVRRVL